MTLSIHDTINMETFRKITTLQQKVHTLEDALNSEKQKQEALQEENIESKVTVKFLRKEIENLRVELAQKIKKQEEKNSELIEDIMKEFAKKLEKQERQNDSTVDHLVNMIIGIRGKRKEFASGNTSAASDSSLSPTVEHNRYPLTNNPATGRSSNLSAASSKDPLKAGDSCDEGNEADNDLEKSNHSFSSFRDTSVSPAPKASKSN